MVEKDWLKDHCLAKGLEGVLASHREIATDLMLVLSSKPTNYSGLGAFTTQQLWTLASNFVRSRQPNAKEREIKDGISELETIFQRCNVDIITFEGLLLPNEFSSGSEQYYHREESIQQIVLSVFHDHIVGSVRLLSERKSFKESKILRVWLEELLAGHAEESRLIELDLESLLHRFHQEYETDSALDGTAVIDMLVRGRFAYPVTERKVCPLWYTLEDPKWLRDLAFGGEDEGGDSKNSLL